MSALSSATQVRRDAEQAYELAPSPKTLKALQAASSAEMNAYLAEFDVRHADDVHTVAPAPSNFIELPPAPSFDTLNRKNVSQYRTKRTRFQGYRYR